MDTAAPPVFSVANFDDKLQINKDVAFATTAIHPSGGVAYGDLTNNGWLDIYVVHKYTKAHTFYLHNGIDKTLDQNTYTTIDGPTTGNRAEGVTFR